MLTRRSFGLTGAAAGITLLSAHEGRGDSLPVIRLGNAAGIIDPQLIYMTMGQHPKLNYYKEEGCTLDIVNMSGSGQTMQTVIAGAVEVSSLAPIVYLSSYVKNPTIDLIYPYSWMRWPHWAIGVKPDSKITTLEQLKGKTIGIRNQGDTGYIGARAMMKEIGLDPDRDVDWTSVGEGGPAGDAVYRGRVDAMAFWDGSFERIAIAGFPLRMLPITPNMKELFGQAYAVRKSDLAKNRDLWVRFFRANARSTVFAIQDIDLSIRMHWEIYPETKPKGKSDEEALSEARRVVNSRKDKWLPAPWQQDKRFGAMDADQWRAEVKFAGYEGQIKDVTPMFTADLIDDINKFDRDKIVAQAKALKGA